MKRALLACAVAGACLAVSASGQPLARAVSTAVCLAKPLGVQFVRSPGRPSGVLTWRKPVKLPLRPAGYRVYRNGKVVGQTGVAVRRLRVSFVPGHAVTFMVRVALRTGAVVPCAGRRTSAPRSSVPTGMS